MGHDGLIGYMMGHDGLIGYLMGHLIQFVKRGGHIPFSALFCCFIHSDK